jgi:GNAT superfamily N-acetyltransferase
MRTGRPTPPVVLTAEERQTLEQWARRPTTAQGLAQRARLLLDRGRSEAGRVGGMWVEPAWRRRGVGRALLQEVFGWARERGLSRLALWAPAHSQAALALYGQAGFRETGNCRPLPTNPSLQIVEMETRYEVQST